MPNSGLNSFIKVLDKEGELIRISSFVNPDLEITEITDRISKQEDGGKAILFENTGTGFPLLINALGSEKRIALAFGRDSIFDLEKEIEGGTRMEIVEVNPQSNAVAAVVQKDDILIFIDELAIHTMDDVRLALLDKAVGETVRISVVRGGHKDGERVDMEVELYSPTAPPGHP